MLAGVYPPECWKQAGVALALYSHYSLAILEHIGLVFHHHKFFYS